MEDDLGKTKSNKAFCVLPWLHLHVMPDSSVIPCCVSPYDDVYGDVSREDVDGIWNNGRFKTLRRQMLRGERPPGCRRCHEMEDMGFSSMRQVMNRRFKDDVKQILLFTSEDGRYHELRLKYIDIRFSNLCNFKCRGCGPTLSSAWHEDHNLLFDYRSDKPKLKSVAADSPAFWERFQRLVMDSQEIYFGGGEPLITKEHFDLLRLLIAQGKTDVDLQYNTNLSTLTYGNHNLADLWGKFRRVTLGISLDDLGKRAEYFRHGTKWKAVEANLRTLRDEYQGIHRYVNCTVNVTNVFYLPELYDELTGEGIIGRNGFNVNMLLDPDELRVDVLPGPVKAEVGGKLLGFCEALEARGDAKAAQDFRNVVNFMGATDNSALLPKFKQKTGKLDAIRGESFAETYPELAGLLGMT